MNQQFRHHDLTDYVNNFVKHKLPKTWNDPSLTSDTSCSTFNMPDRRPTRQRFRGVRLAWHIIHSSSILYPKLPFLNYLSLNGCSSSSANNLDTCSSSSSSFSFFSQKMEPWLTPPLHLSHQISSVLAFCHCLIHAHKINIIRASWSDSQGVLMRGTDNQNASKEGHWERQYRRARLKTAESGWMIGAVDDAIAEGRECDYNLRVGIHDLTLV